LSFGTPAGITLGTSVASTSGTSIDFTGIPSGVKTITLLFNAVSKNGSSNFLIQIGSGTVTTSGYSSTASFGGALATSTAGFVILSNNASYLYTGNSVIENLSGNLWICTGVGTHPNTSSNVNSGNVTIGGVLNILRLTTVNGTDTFDAGSINIMYQ
jgi:hypothetical protein